MNIFNQHTLRGAFSFSGTSLHSGLCTQVTVYPALPNTGYTFIRTDLQYAKISGRWSSADGTSRIPVLRNTLGAEVSNAEPLLAGLFANGVDNATILTNTHEIPMINGNAGALVDSILGVGIKDQNTARRAIRVKEPVVVYDGLKVATLLPWYLPLDIELNYQFKTPALGEQTMAMPLTTGNFNKHVANARTFRFTEQITAMQSLGYLKGHNDDNVIMISDDEIVNADGLLRYPNEVARHNYVNTVGDMALAGAHIIGKYEGNAADHNLNFALLRALMRSEGACEHTTLQQAISSSAPPKRNNGTYGGLIKDRSRVDYDLAPRHIKKQAPTLCLS